MKTYEIALEISGPTAMWTRPDTGDSPVSYPVPTFSAAKGIFESIVSLATVDMIPNSVEICAPVIYHGYTTNYGGPLKKTGKHGYQLLATVLINVCYRFYGEVRFRDGINRDSLSKKARLQIDKGCNQLHACQEIFLRRIKKGQCNEMPFLGWREFVPDYFGPFRDKTRVEEGVNISLPSLLHSVFEPTGEKRPLYKCGKSIKNGRLEYA